MRRIGIIGGAYDPIHNGHLLMGEKALKYVEEVWYQPCFSHMYSKKMADPYKRLEMCNLAVEKLYWGSLARGKMRVSSYEIDKRLECCTYEVLLEMKKDFPEVEFQLIIGQDNAESISQWKRNEELRRDFACVVFRREFGRKPTQHWYDQTPHLFANDAIPDHSSTDLRQVLSSWMRPNCFRDEKECNVPWQILVEKTPEVVLRYIDANQLYMGDDYALVAKGP